jgi:hypothetical protein
MNRYIKGQIDASLLIPLIVGLLYAGTGGWTAERWNTALAIIGIGAGTKMGYERGFNTYNPGLRQPRDEHGRFAPKKDEP